MKKLYFLLMCIAAFLFLSCRNDDGSLPVDDNPSEEIENPETDIFDFSPALGGWGTKVTIRGENFDPVPEGNEVLFNGMLAQVESASKTTLVAIVPEDATTGKIRLSANGYDYTSFQDFTVLLPPPIISDFEPKTGVEGDQVIFTGDHFGDNPNFVEVLFHNSGIPAEIVSITDEQLVVTVNDADTGVIQITAYGQTSSTSEDFTYLPWRRRANFEDEPRRFGVAEAIGDDIYMGTGSGPNGLLADLWKYSPETDNWNQMVGFPGVARIGAFHFVLNGFLYVGAGTDLISETGPNDFYRFDPKKNEWIPLNDFPGNPNQVRQFSTSFVIDDKAYVYGGWHANGVDDYHNTLWEYDPVQDTWEQKAGFEPVGRSSPISFSIENKGYVATGFSSQPTWLSDIWEYDPNSNTWTEKAGLPNGMERYSAFGFSFDGKGYLGMGSWSSKTIFPGNSLTAWPFATATANGKAYIGLGRQYFNNVYEFPADIWEYTPRHDE